MLRMLLLSNSPFHWCKFLSRNLNPRSATQAIIDADLCVFGGGCSEQLLSSRHEDWRELDTRKGPIGWSSQDRDYFDYQNNFAELVFQTPNSAMALALLLLLLPSLASPFNQT